MIKNDIQCITCIKKDVCKYSSGLEKLYSEVNDVEKEGIFTINIYCKSYNFNGKPIKRGV